MSNILKFSIPRKSTASMMNGRAIGSVMDAEDIVQEAYLRWQRRDDTAVQSPKAYLSAIVTRLSIDHLRAVKGTKVAGLVRERPGRDDGARKVSLRATDDDVDVSRIARAQGGGGHRRAAGFTTQLADAELLVFLRAAVAEQLA